MGDAYDYQRKLRIMLTVCLSVCVWDSGPVWGAPCFCTPSNMINMGQDPNGEPRCIGSAGWLGKPNIFVAAFSFDPELM